MNVVLSSSFPKKQFINIFPSCYYNAMQKISCFYNDWNFFLMGNLRKYIGNNKLIILTKKSGRIV